jgi:hypothetical protein
VIPERDIRSRVCLCLHIQGEINGVRCRVILQLTTHDQIFVLVKTDVVLYAVGSPP